MSFAAEGWAWKQEAPSSSAKLVLVCLGWYADKIGTDAYPSMPTICRRTQLVERTVRKAIKDLLEAGLIGREHRTAPNQRCISNIYRLIIRESTPANMQGQRNAPTPADLPEVFAVGEEPRPPHFRRGSPANVQGNPVLQPSKEGTGLRPVAPALPPPIAPDVRRDLFTEGVPLMRGLTGKSDGACRAMIGKLLKAGGDDCARLLDALRRAAEFRPAEPFSFLMAIVGREQLGVIDQLRRDWGITQTFLAPVFDEDDPDPTPAPSFLLEGAAS